MTRTLPLALLVLALLLSACGATQTGSTQPTTAPSQAPTTAAPASGQPVKIGSKNFTEAILVAEMYALMLEDAGIPVERKFNLGATPVAQAAIVNGDIDLYPEYTSTGLLEVLKQQPIADAAGILAAVRQGYEQNYKLTWLEPSPFNNTNALATTTAVADKYGLKTYSDLAKVSGEVRLGGPPEFPERQDTAGLFSTYGFDEKMRGDNYVQLDTGALRYDALQKGDIDVVVAFGTDGQINGLGLVLLQDDKNYYPIYNIAPVVRQDTLAATPSIAAQLNKLAPALTNDVMSGLNWQVDGPDKREVADVARTFLQEQGLIQK